MNIKIEGLPTGQRIKRLKFDIVFDDSGGAEGTCEIENENETENHFQEPPAPPIPPEMTDMDF